MLPERLAALARDLAPANGAPLASLSLGGGFADDHPGDAAFERYATALAPLAGQYALAHESGRAIFADAGVFATRVVAVKTWQDRTIAVCDGGLSHAFLLAQTESVMRRLAAPSLVRRTAEPPVRGVPTIYVGSTCSRADVIGRDDTGAPPQVGDIAVFARCGVSPHVLDGAFPVPRSRARVRAARLDPPERSRSNALISVADLLEHGAARWPQHPAYADGGGTMTYEQLARAVRRAAAVLASRGVQPASASPSTRRNASKPWSRCSRPTRSARSSCRSIRS